MKYMNRTNEVYYRTNNQNMKRNSYLSGFLSMAAWGAVIISILFSSCHKPDKWTQIMDSYLPGDTVQQLLLVKHTEGSNAVAEFYVKEDGAWNLVEEGAVFIGKNGLGKQKEGDMKTPVGEFTANTAFGILPDPGTGLPYIQATSSIFGCADSCYYNQMIDTAVVHHPNCNGEHIIDYVPHYNYGLAISYNPDGIVGLGSCIYVHCKGPNPYTAGCVALDEEFMRNVLVHSDSRLRISIH